MKDIENFYWDIERLYTEGANPKKISQTLSCDLNIVYEVLTDLGEMGTGHKPKRGKIHNSISLDD